MSDTAKIASDQLGSILNRNRKYAAEKHVEPLKFWYAIPRIRETREAVVAISCSDPRLDLKQVLGVYQEPLISLFQILNPGGRAHSAINALAAVQAVNNAGTILVIHHSDCGMIHVSDNDVRKYLLDIAPEDKDTIAQTKFGEISIPIEETIKEDVAYLRNASWVKSDIQIHGLKYDFVTGLLEQVV